MCMLNQYSSIQPLGDHRPYPLITSDGYSNPLDRDLLSKIVLLVSPDISRCLEEDFHIRQMRLFFIDERSIGFFEMSKKCPRSTMLRYSIIKRTSLILHNRSDIRQDHRSIYDIPKDRFSSSDLDTLHPKIWEFSSKQKETSDGTKGVSLEENCSIFDTWKHHRFRSKLCP